MWRIGCGEGQGGLARPEEGRLIRKLLQCGREIMTAQVAASVLEKARRGYVRIYLEGKSDSAC